MTASRKEGLEPSLPPQKASGFRPDLSLVLGQGSGEFDNDEIFIQQVRGFIIERAMIPGGNDTQRYAKHGVYSYPRALPGFDVIFSQGYTSATDEHNAEYWHEITAIKQKNDRYELTGVHIRIASSGEIFCDHAETPAEGEELFHIRDLMNVLQNATDETPSPEVLDYLRSQTPEGKLRKTARHVLSRLITPLRRSRDNGRTP